MPVSNVKGPLGIGSQGCHDAGRSFYAVFSRRNSGPRLRPLSSRQYHLSLIKLHEMRAFSPMLGESHPYRGWS